MRWMLALVAVLAAGCPRFDGSLFACGPEGDCPDALACVDGVCREPIAFACGGRCGIVDGQDCGACLALYVSAEGTTSGDGSMERPFATLTAALARATADTSTIHVAPGAYGPGEVFPLVIRGLTVLAAGATLRGAGPIPIRLNGFENLDVSVVVGHGARATLIRGLDVLVAGPADIGVLCDAGTSAPFESELPAANTRLERVSVRGEYARGGVVVSASELGACNLVASNLLVSGARIGVWSNGQCGQRLWPAFRLEGTRIEDAVDTGVLSWDCTRAAHLYDVTIERAGYGVWAIQHGTDPSMPVFFPSDLRVLASRILGAARAGIKLERSARLIELRGTTITEGAVGVWLEGQADQRADEPYPSVVRARQNHIESNAVGVWYGQAFHGLDVASDWGTPTDRGLNTLRCNSDGARGVDLLVGPQATPGVVLSFSGNIWDHPSPTERVASDADGLDILNSNRVPLDLSNPLHTAAECPSDRARGP